MVFMKFIHNKNVKVSHVFLIAIVFVFLFKFFQSTPFEAFFFQLQAGYLVGIFVFVLLYLYQYVFINKKINRIILYFILLIFIVPIYSGVRSLSVFEQPFVYGVLSERNWIALGVGVWLYFVLSMKKISFESLEYSFVFMAWLSILSFSLIVVLYDAGNLTEISDSTKYVYLSEDRGVRFKFQNYFITFGVIYYFIKYTKKSDVKYLFFTIFFLLYVLLVIQGRTYSMTLIMTFILFYWFNHSHSKFLVNLIKAVFFVIFFIIVFNLFQPDFLKNMVYLYSQMFDVMTGVESKNSSANSRIFQSLIVLDFFDENTFSILFGAGRLSNQWNGGFSSFFGYFFPSDVGLLGGVFLYGLLGFVFLCLIPFIASIKVININKNENGLFVVSMKYILVFSLIRSIQGSFYFEYVNYIVPLCILISSIKKKEKINA